MRDRFVDQGETVSSGDRVERIVERQLALMQKQLELVRCVEAQAATATSRSSWAQSVAPEDPSDRAVHSTARQVPMTDAQRDVWVACQLSPDASAAYNLSTALELRGTLDVAALHESLRRLVARHDALRSTIDSSGEQMIVWPTATFDLPLVDLSDRSESGRTAEVQSLLDHELTRPYDLAAGPLFRFSLVRLAAEAHLLVLSAHHLVCDGSSFGVMHRDAGVFYSALMGAEVEALGPATRPVEFASFHADHGEVSERYWLDTYPDVPSQLDLPVDAPRAPVRTFKYATTRAIVDGPTLAELKEFATREGVTVFVVLLAAWQLMLHRLSGQIDFASGVFVSGQASMGVNDLVGLCANLVPLRARIAPEEPVDALLARLRNDTFEAFDHQHYPLGRLASMLQLPRDPSRPTMVSTVITMETPTEGVHFAGLRVTEAVHGRRAFGFFDVELYLTETAEDLKVDLQYAAALFEPDTMERWLGHYLHLVREILECRGSRVSELRMLTDRERHELLTQWNATDASIPLAGVHQRFEEAVARHPDRLAMIAGDSSFTYRELDARANRLARHLRESGVARNRLVGVNLERSADMVVALLAVLKAGGAYVPLDPLFPHERLTLIASDAGLDALVTQASLLGTIDLGEVAVVVVDRDAAVIAHHDETDPGFETDPNDLAYTIYTSGSTGRPKGVEITHGALANLLESMRLTPGLDESDTLLALTTMSFDIAGLELFLPLITGATLLLADQIQAVDAVWLRDRLDAGDITVMQATPATWQMLLDAGWSGTPGLKALCGGEALSRELADALLARVESLWNMYGPTETTIWSSVCRVEMGESRITLGQPIANTELHVLDPDGRVQPIGVAGELWIGGHGLARGYRNRDDLTQERFVEVRLEDASERRLYRTGDLARRLADGSIEYLGRADFQVKIRGYRIELGEIETVLARHPDVKECVVAARDAEGSAKRLVAYLIPAGPGVHNITALRAYLRDTLPEYMVPATFVILDEFPLTANKKVDRAHLPEPDNERPELATRLVAPRTEAERVLARIWQDLLGLEHVGVEDNFFDLGGDSLLGLRFIMRANRAGLALTPISIFRHQTIAELARAAEEAAHMPSSEQGIVTGPVPLTPAQIRFLTERRTPDPHHWNISSLASADRLAPVALRAALRALLRHHDALRLRLWQEDGTWRQEVAGLGSEIPLETHHLATVPVAERAAAIDAVCARLQSSFDLSEPPLVRVAHFINGPDDRDRLFVAIHHFAVDGLTWSVFWEDLEQAYRQALEGHAVTLPPKTTSFRSWAMQLEQLAQSPTVEGTASAWLELPWEKVKPLPLDVAGPSGPNDNRSAASVSVEFSLDETTRLMSGRRRPEHVIISALSHCLSRWTESSTILLDILSHGRDATLDGANLARTVAFTLSYNPLVLSHPSWDPVPEVVEAVSRQIDALPDGFSFELLRFLAKDPQLRSQLTQLPRAEVLFNYAGADEASPKDTMFIAAVESSGAQGGPSGLRQYPIAVRATLVPNLRLTFVYSTNLHAADTIRMRAAEVADAIRAHMGIAVGAR